VHDTHGVARRHLRVKDVRAQRSYTHIAHIADGKLTEAWIFQKTSKRSTLLGLAPQTHRHAAASDIGVRHGTLRRAAGASRRCQRLPEEIALPSSHPRSGARGELPRLDAFAITLSPRQPELKDRVSKTDRLRGAHSDAVNDRSIFSTSTGKPADG